MSGGKKYSQGVIQSCGHVTHFELSDEDDSISIWSKSLRLEANLCPQCSKKLCTYKKINRTTGVEEYVYHIHKEKATSIHPIDVEDSLDFEPEYTLKELEERFPPSLYHTVEVKNES